MHVPQLMFDNHNKYLITAVVINQ